MGKSNISKFHNSSIADKDTQISEDKSIGSPIRILRNNQRAEFQNLNLYASTDQIDEIEEHVHVIKNPAPSNGKDYLKGRSIKKGCKKMVKLIDQHLYKN
jgi:hypothetical protein